VGVIAKEKGKDVNGEKNELWRTCADLPCACSWNDKVNHHKKD
jgi:hypothetical protein